MIKLLAKQIFRDPKWNLVLLLVAAIGAFSFLTIHGFRVAVESGLQERLKGALGADISVTSRTLFTPNQVEVAVTAAAPAQTASMQEFFSMVVHGESSRLVLLRAPDQNYPLKSNLTLASGRTFSLKPDTNTAIIDRDLHQQMGIRVGDWIELGRLKVKVIDILEADPSQTFRLGSLAPRVYIPKSLLPKSGLISDGTTITDILYFNLPINADIEAVKSALLKALPDPGVRVQTPDDFAGQMSRPIQIVGDFLSLLSIGSLVLTNIGLFYLCRLYFIRRLKSTTLLELMGYSRHTLAGLQLLEMMLVAGCGALIGILGAFWTVPSLSFMLPEGLSLQLNPSLFFTPSALTALNYLILPISYLLPQIYSKDLSLAFAALNDGFSYTKRSQGWPSAFFLLAPVYLITLAFYVAPSWKIIATYWAAIGIFAFLSFIISRFIFIFVSKFASQILFRLVMLRILRAPFHFGIIVATFSLCITFVSLLFFLGSALKSEFESPEIKRPSLFVFDLPDESMPKLTSYLDSKSLTPLNLSPILRGRILEVNGQGFERAEVTDAPLTREAETEQRFRNRGVNFTIRDTLSPSESLVAGQTFQDLPESSRLESLSLEKRYADRMGFNLGDKIKFEIQGLEFDYTVTQLRSIKWNAFVPNFFVQVPSGLLDEAPKTWLVALDTHSSEQKLEVQTELARLFPSASVLDIESLITQLIKWSDDFVKIMTTAAFLQFIIGSFVILFLVRIEFKTRDQEFQLYPFIGINQKQVKKMILYENIITATVSLALGMGYSWGLTQVLLLFVFRS